MIESFDPKGSAVRKPLISVCIATYNQQGYIRDAVMSVLTQVNSVEFDLEILVGDDCSTDSTPVILQELALLHPERMTVVTHRPNIGASENLQVLMHRSRGDFVAHLDGDDYWLPGKLSAQLAFLNLHQECAAVYTSAIVVDADGVLVGGFSNPQPEIISFDYLLARGNFLNHSSLMYRGRLLDSLCTLEVPFIDYMIHLRLAQQGSLGILSAAFVVYRRMTGTSMLRNQFQHFDDLYLQTIVAMAAQAPALIRYGCCATYFVNTLGVRPPWVWEKEFWGRVKTLMRQLGLQPFKLILPIAVALLHAVRKVFVARLAHLLYQHNSLIIVHPRH